MLTKKIALGVLAGLYGATSAYAAEEATKTFIYKPFGLNPVMQTTIPDWTVSDSVYSNWENEESVFDCSEWAPPVNLVDLDEAFTQSRECSQTQLRNRTDTKYSARLDQTRSEGPFEESRVIDVEESQDAVGTRDFITGVREDAFTPWEPIGGFYDCGLWSPSPETVDYGTGFTQSRDCLWDEERERDVFNTWQSGQETYLRTDEEDRTVDYVDSRAATGTYRNWQDTSSTFTPWVDVGDDHTFTLWTPEANSQSANFVQSRDFKHDQTRYEQFREQDSVTGDYRNTGSPVLRTQTVDRDEDRTVNVAFTDWSETGRSEYSGWTPLPSAQTTGFTQSRTYTLSEDRERVYTAPVDGELGRFTEKRDIEDVSESRSVTVMFTEWSEVGSNYDCGSWAPLPNTVGVGESYTQTRSCKQNETRDRVYMSGGEELARFEEDRTLTPVQSQTNTGVGSWVGYESTYTDWVNDGARYAYATWSPKATSQTSTFQQERGFKQNETRNEQKREQDVHSDTIRDVGGKIRHDRTVTGKETRSITVDYTNWVNSGGLKNCESWAPLTNTVGYNEAYTQTRECEQVQVRDRVYSAGSTNVERVGESRTVKVTDSQNAVGTGTWVSTSSTFTNWTNSGSRYGYSGYSPVPNTQTSNFVQKRSYSQKQVRNEQKREKDSIGGSIRNTGSPIQRSQVIGGEESRTITVSASGWVNGAASNYSGWSPAPTTQTSNYTRSRTYSRAQTRTWTYKAGSSVEHTRVEPRTLTGQKQTQTVVVSWSSWANNGSAHTCSGYSPATNTKASGEAFTQSRSCKQPQKRTRYYKVGSETIGSATETKDVNVTQTQAATGVGSWVSTSSTFTNWTNSGSRYGYSGYSPVPNTQTSNFVQKRSYSQKQVRNEQKREKDSIGGSIRNTGSPIQRSQVIGGEESRTITVSASGWVNGAASNYSGWSPAPTTQTSNYTRSRTYNRAQSRTWTYKAGSSVEHTRVEPRTLTGEKETQTVVVSWSNWANNGSVHTCSGYSPATNTKAYNASFTQSRSCKQPQKRTRYYKVGSTTIGSATETQNVNVTQTRSAKGVGSWKATSSTFTNWTNSGGRYGYSGYSPAPNTQTSNFVQKRSYSQKQVRNEQKREKDSIGGSIRNTGSPIQHSQVIGGEESRTITVTASGWVNGAASNFSNWSPAPTTQTSNYTRSRTYNRAQSRTWTYKAGSSVEHTRVEPRTLTGQKQTQTVVVSWSNWANNGSVHTCSGYSPATNTKASGQSFTQSRSCKQPQKRTRYYKVGSETIGSATETKNINVTQTRSATGVGNWVSTSSTFTNWTNSGGRYGYSGYSPVPNTQTSNFVQKRSYSQKQVRNEQKREKDSIGGSIRNTGSPIPRSQVISGQEPRTITVSVSGWVNGAASNISEYSPKPTTQTSNYTRTRTYDRAQSRTWTYKAGSSVEHTRVEPRTLKGQTYSQTVVVSWSSWVNNGSVHSCSGYSPATNTKAYNTSFTQSRSCKQPQKRTRYYKVGSTTIGSATETQNVNVTQTRSAKGVGSWKATTSTYTSWTNYGSPDITNAWAPTASTQTADFGQTRGVRQPQERYEQKREKDSIGGSIRNTGSPVRQTRANWQDQSRHVDVSVGSWGGYQSKYGYSDWNKAISDQTSSFNQTRNYSQNRYRTWYYKVGSESIHTRSETQATRFSETRRVDVSHSSWVNNGSAHSCGGYSPATNTKAYNASFTQSRTCKQPQKRTRYYKTGSTQLDTTPLTQTVNVTQTRSAKGVGNWVSTSSTYTGWADYGSAYGHGSWSPTPSTEKSNFTQSRSYKVNQRRYEQKRQRDSIGGSYRNTGSPIEHTQVSNRSQNRTIAVSWGGWFDSGSSSCPSWSVNSSTGAKSRTCTQPTKRYRYYKHGSTEVAKKAEYSTRSFSQSVTVTGVSYGSYGSWKNTGGVFSCSSYSPAASTKPKGTTFTQSRTCKQKQYRQRSKYNNLSDGSKHYLGKVNAYQNVNVTQTKGNVAGTKIVEECKSNAIVVDFTGGGNCNVELATWTWNGTRIAHTEKTEDCGGSDTFKNNGPATKTSGSGSMMSAIVMTYGNYNYYTSGSPSYSGGDAYYKMCRKPK